jgi:hypothetical protein
MSFMICMLPEVFSEKSCMRCCEDVTHEAIECTKNLMHLLTLDIMSGTKRSSSP